MCSRTWTCRSVSRSKKSTPAWTSSWVSTLCHMSRSCAQGRRLAKLQLDPRWVVRQATKGQVAAPAHRITLCSRSLAVRLCASCLLPQTSIPNLDQVLLQMMQTLLRGSGAGLQRMVPPPCLYMFFARKFCLSSLVAVRPIRQSIGRCSVVQTLHCCSVHVRLCVRQYLKLCIPNRTCSV